LVQLKNEPRIRRSGHDKERRGKAKGEIGEKLANKKAEIMNRENLGKHNGNHKKRQSRSKRDNPLTGRVEPVGGGGDENQRK